MLQSQICVLGGAGTLQQGCPASIPAVSPPPSPAVPTDAGGVQVSTHPEAGAEGEAGHDAALRAEAAQGADQVPGPAVEEEQHEDHVGHLPESAAPPER